MSKRIAVSKKTRFEVFKRDSFTCQYCGSSAPDVVLECDHINPVAGGGGNDILNLVTSCKDCNSGKGARELSDRSAIAKQKAQLDELNERRQQLEMMVEWREGLADLHDDAVNALAAAFAKFSGRGFTETGRRNAGKWLRKYTLAELLDALQISCDQYLVWNGSDSTNESAAKAFEYTPRVAAGRKRETDKPYMRDLFYIRGILRNRLDYVDERLSLILLERAVLAGANIDSLRSFSKSVRNWTAFKDEMESFLQEHEVVK